MLAQHGDQFGLPADGLLANDLREQGAARRGAVVIEVGPEHIGSLHKVARILHKNAAAVNEARRTLIIRFAARHSGLQSARSKSVVS
jgi:hypothetical protein